MSHEHLSAEELPDTWTNAQRALFAELFDQLKNNQELYTHPSLGKLPRHVWRTTAWNLAWAVVDEPGRLAPVVHQDYTRPAMDPAAVPYQPEGNVRNPRIGPGRVSPTVTIQHVDENDYAARVREELVETAAPWRIWNNVPRIPPEPLVVPLALPSDHIVSRPSTFVARPVSQLEEYEALRSAIGNAAGVSPLMTGIAQAESVIDRHRLIRETMAQSLANQLDAQIMAGVEQPQASVELTQHGQSAGTLTIRAARVTTPT